jgi:hypothetical protein
MKAMPIALSFIRGAGRTKPKPLSPGEENRFCCLVRNRSRGDRDSLPDRRDRRDIPFPPNESAGLENPAYRGFRAP